MTAYLSTVPWWGWAIGLFVLGTSSRMIGNLLALALLGGLACIAVACFATAFSIAAPMISQSWRHHEAAYAQSRHYDTAEGRAKIAAAACPEYQNAGWLRQTFHFETRALAWCADYPNVR